MERGTAAGVSDGNSGGVGMSHLHRVALAVCPLQPPRPMVCEAPCSSCLRIAAAAGHAYSAILQEAYGGSSLTAERISAIASSIPTTIQPAEG